MHWYTDTSMDTWIRLIGAQKKIMDGLGREEAEAKEEAEKEEEEEENERSDLSPCPPMSWLPPD